MVVQLSDLIGSKRTFRTIHTWFKELPKPLLLLGQPGVGKTTAAILFSEHYDYIPVEVNASDERTKSDAKEVIKSLRANSLSGKQKMLVIDEADGLPFRDGLNPFLQSLFKLKIPFILIANEPLPGKTKSQCQTVTFKPPTLYDFKELAKRLEVELPSPLPFHSFRDLVNWAGGGDATAPDLYRTTTDLMKDSFKGNRPSLSVDKYQHKSLLDHYLASGGDPNIASTMDLMMHQGRIDHAVDILQSYPMQMTKPPWWQPTRKTGRAVFLGFQKVYE